MTAAPVPDEDYHAIARIDQLVNPHVVCRPWLKPVEPHTPEPVHPDVFRASLPYGHRLKAWVEQVCKRLSGRLEEALVPNERRDVRIWTRDQRPDQL